MEKFIKPELKVITFSNEDIIQTSGEVTPPPTATPTPTTPTINPDAPDEGGWANIED